MRQITEALFSMQDEKYRAFHGALMPTVERERIIGVRMPALRRYTAALGKKTGGSAFFAGSAPYLLRGK